MSIFARTVTAILLAGLCTTPYAAAQSRETDPEAAAAFRELVEAYRRRPALTVHTTVKVDLTQDGVNAGGPEVKATFILGPPGTGIVELRGFTCYVAGGRITAVHESTGHSYYSVSDDGSPYYALMNEFVDIPFPHLAIAFGEKDLDDLYMQFHQMAPWIRPTAVGEVQGDGRTLKTIVLSSDFAELTIEYDPATMLMDSIVLDVTGGTLVQPGAKLTYTHTFDYETHDEPLPPDTFVFEPGKRQRVDMITTLVKMPERDIAAGPAGEQPDIVGKPAPGFTLATLDGGAVNLADLRGKVVVLDFWATWCGPCRHALPMLNEVAEWVKRQQAPATIITVNVWERGGPDQRLDAARDYWKEQGFTMPVAMDYTDATAAAYGVSAIPTTVIIGPDGVVHAMHVGAVPDYVDTLKREIIDAFEAAPDKDEAVVK